MTNPLHCLKTRKTLILLFLILLTGTFFRMWGLSSVYQRVDDPPVAKHIQAVYFGNWHPDAELYYPVFFNYLAAGLLRLLSVFLAVIGVHQGPGLYEFSFDDILLIARILSSLMGSLTVAVVFAIGKKLFSERVALLASFLFSVSFVHILYSHQIVLDVPMTFFYAVSLYFCVMILERNKLRDYLAAAFAGGLAVSTKYNGIFIVASIFLAHLLAAFEIRKKILRIMVDPKLLAAGLFSVIGFFVGHPFALLHFPRFLRASSVLLNLVHETEWYLTPIKPENVIEFIKYNKYFQAVQNIFQAEGPVYMALISLGVIAIVMRRNRKTAFLAISGLVYFLGALGFVGFSRLRDLSTLALFYAFLGALGIFFILDLLKKRRALRVAGLTLFVAAAASLEYGAFSKTYLIWEDDTTEVAERWIKRNIPTGSSFAKEWFTPALSGQDRRFRAFSRPFLYWSDFPPFEKFDFIISSSTAHGHFLKNWKFYPEAVKTYRNLSRNHELVKTFSSREMEFKNPEVKIFNVRNPGRDRPRIALPYLIAEENPAREFVAADGSPYGKEINSFFLRGGDETTRIIISRKKIPRLAVFVSHAENDGKLKINSSLLKKTLDIRKKEPASLLFRPRLSFPFIKYIYRVDIRSSPELQNAFIKISHDPFTIALEFFNRGDFPSARDNFLKALGEGKAEECEIHLYLALCSRMLGRAEEAETHRGLAGKAASWQRYVRLFDEPGDDGEWVRNFEKLSGIDYELYAGTQTWLVDDGEFEFSHGMAVESAGLMRMRALMPGGPDPGRFLAVSPGKKLPPQDYWVNLYFYNPHGVQGLSGELEVQFQDGAGSESLKFPIILGPVKEKSYSGFSAAFEHKNINREVRFTIRMETGRGLAFDYLELSPDLREFFKKKRLLFRELLEGGKP